MNIINNTVTLISTNIPKISTALLILVSFYLLGNFIKSIIVKNLIKNNSNPSLIKFLGKIIKNIFLIIGLVSSAGTLGGGHAGGSFNSRSRIQTARRITWESAPVELLNRMLAWPSRPPRCCFGESVTRRNVLP